MDRLKLALIFGGRSSEHEISCLSAMNVYRAIDRERYDVLLIGITKTGRWVYAENDEAVKDGSWQNGSTRAVLSPDAEEHCLYLMPESGDIEKVSIDLIFPVLHGLNGEDGTVQGLFELTGIPYVGCGVQASANSMDKVTTKLIVDRLGIRQAKYAVVYREELKDAAAMVERVEKTLEYPVFVKPSCAGSSVGVTKAENRDMLLQAFDLAAQHDRKILIEESIIGREIECAVLTEGGETQASGVGEVIAAAEFYDYDAKYHNDASVTDTHPVLPDGIEDEVRSDAVRIFDAIGGHGLSRVDFFLTADGVVFNEINTLPGFTAISMYPMLWETRGLAKETLIETLIASAYTRHDH